MTYQGPARPTDEELQRANTQINAAMAPGAFEAQLPEWHATWSARYMVDLEWDDKYRDLEEAEADARATAKFTGLATQLAEQVGYEQASREPFVREVEVEAGS